MVYAVFKVGVNVREIWDGILRDKIIVSIIDEFNINILNKDVSYAHLQDAAALLCHYGLFPVPPAAESNRSGS